jgi:sulfate-transporting ATPase
MTAPVAFLDFSLRQKTLKRELEWVRMSQKAKQSKGKARLNAYDKLMDEESKEREKKLELFIPPGPRLGDVVIEAEGLSKAFGNKLLFENLSFSIPKNGIVFCNNSFFLMRGVTSKNRDQGD